MTVVSAVALAGAAAAFALAAPNASAQQQQLGPVPTLTTAQARALAAADRAALSGLDGLARGADETLVRRDAVPGQGNLFYVAYDRTYRGLPVVGGDAVVVADGTGAVRSVSSSITKPPVFNSTAFTVNPERATTTARASVPGAYQSTAPRKIVLARDSGNRLAWETVVDGVRGGLPSKMHVYVDGHSGAILDSWDEVVFDTGNGFHNGTVTIDVTPGRMVDPGRPGVQCAQQGQQPFTNVGTTWGNGSGTDLKTACVDAFYGAGRLWEMLRTWLGRNGIDGNGRGFSMFVGLNEANAFWNGSSATFGRSRAGDRQATAIDVVAHELGHGIFQFTPGGAGGGGNEKGGLNESTGDIFGALTEWFANNPNDAPDFLVGEKVNLSGNGHIRNMANPSQRGHPNCFSAAIPGTEVHAAAGPQNHWFYLLANGSNPTNGQPTSPTCNNSTITGIGIQKAGQIFLATLQRKVTAWTHARARVASLQAAVQLFPGSCTEFNAVRNSWAAVSVPAQPGEPTCTGGPGQNDFSITLNPTSRTIPPGNSTSTTVSTQTTSGVAQTVNFSASGVPSGVTASFNPTSVQSGGTSTLTFTVDGAAPSGTFTITVTGTGTSATHTATFSLTIGAGSPSPTPPGGGTWAPNVNYAVGDRVTFDGVTYVCRIAHRSQSDWTPPATPALWQPVA